jgi:hypothetical protein
MSPLMISAHFAAYIWFTAQPDNISKDRDAAMRFAREKWEEFLPVADPGVGRLLLRMAEPPAARRRERRLRRAARTLAAHASVCPMPPQPVLPQAVRPVSDKPFSCN